MTAPVPPQAAAPAAAAAPLNLQVVYCTYRSSDLSVRERLAFGSDETVLAAHEAMKLRFPGSEHVVVSTCNRVEVYLARPSEQPTPTRDDIAAFLAEFHGLQADTFLNDLLREEGSQAARHLFEVAASIDSMVVGESQIVSQVKKAYELATRGDASGPVMHTLFQRALKVASRVRAETTLSEGRLSVASVAVGEFARQIFNRFSDKRVVVFGAGEMARETLQYLHRDGVAELIVLNRNQDRGTALATEFGGCWQPWDSMGQALAAADIVVSATGASDPVLTRAQFEAARGGNGETILLLDLGAPRDIDPTIADAGDEVYLYNVDDLQAMCEQNRHRRKREIRKAQSIIDNETDRFLRDMQHRATGPIIRELRESWKQVSDAELADLMTRLPHLSDADRGQVERTIHRIVGKLLHPPLEAIREDARQDHPDGLTDALRRLFRLPAAERSGTRSGSD